MAADRRIGPPGDRSVRGYAGAGEPRGAMTAAPHDALSGALRLPGLAGRRVVVTGGASGIGKCITAVFLSQGCTVDAVDIDDAAIAAVAAELHSDRLRCHRADLADDGEREAAMKALAALGPIDVMVTNAANDTRHRWDAVSPAEWRRTLAINLDHQFFCAQAAARTMVAQGRGVIVMLGSIAPRRAAGQPAMAGYLTAKAGIDGLVRALARELGAHGIRVVGVVPGSVDTERQRRLWQTPEHVAGILAAQAIRHRLDGWDIAWMAAFLASDTARGCTGQSYLVDAGLI